MLKMIDKAKKVASVSVDFGDGIRTTVTADDLRQKELDNLFTKGINIAPKLHECALRHLDEFSIEDQELIKLMEL